MIKSVEAQTIASCRRVVPDLSAMQDYRCDMYETLYHWLADHAIASLESELAIYYNTEYVESDIDMELGTPIDRATFKEATVLPEAIRLYDLPTVNMMASLVHRGDIWNVGQAMAALYSWLGSHGYASAGPYRELHLFWRELEVETEQFKNIAVEVQIPIMPLATPQ